MSNTKEAKKRGSACLNYIPPQYRAIKGVENLSTRRQLLRLREFFAIRPECRPAYFRLGASVPNFRKYPDLKPSVTYVVQIDGIMEVIQLELDPRRAEHWFSRPGRPWNLSQEFGKELAS